jgi:hypothetical protein
VRAWFTTTFTSFCSTTISANAKLAAVVLR